MKKQKLNAKTCEYCEDDCRDCKLTDDCLFCKCLEGLSTNIDCSRCKHDMAYCTCSPELIRQDLDNLLKELWIEL